MGPPYLQALVDDLGVQALAEREALRGLRSHKVRTTAIVCRNDLCTAGVVLEAQGLARLPLGALRPGEPINQLRLPLVLHARASSGPASRR